MQFTSEQRLDDGVLEREFTLGEIPGTLWTPEIRRTGPADPDGPQQRPAQGGIPGWWPGPGTPRRTATRWPPSTPPGAVTGPVPPPTSRPAPTSAGRCRPASRSTRSSSPSSARWSKRRSRNGGPPWTPSSAARDRRPGRVLGGGPPSAFGWRWSSRASRPPVSSPGVTCPAPSARRPGRSPFRCCSCCSGTTKGTPGNGPWTCSTPSAPRRRRCTPMRAGTPCTPWFEVEDGDRFFARHLHLSAPNAASPRRPSSGRTGHAGILVPTRTEQDPVVPALAGLLPEIATDGVVDRSGVDRGGGRG